MLKPEDYRRYLSHINDPSVDLSTKIRLADQIRRATEQDPVLTDKLGLKPADLDRLPHH